MKKQNGITLIALIITIIVMLILAAVSINVAIGDNGIFKQADTAKRAQKLAEYDEKIKLIVLEEQTSKIADKKEERLIQLVKENLQDEDWVSSVEELGESYLKVKTTDNYELIYQITDKGTVNKKAEVSKDTYTVIYDANGGSEEPENQTAKLGESVTISSVEPTKDGYVFMGWATSSTATSAEYEKEDIYTTGETVILYAVWTSAENVKYKITYHCYWSDGSDMIWTDYKKHGSDEFYLATANRWPCSNFYGIECIGWSTSSTEKNIEYQLGQLYTENESIDLYPVYEDAIYVKKYTDNTYSLSSSPIATLDGKNLSYVEQAVKTKDMPDSAGVLCNSNIIEITILDEIKLKTAKNFFKNCENMNKINNLSNLNLSEVTDMSDMFWNCKSLTSVDLNGLNTGNITDMSNMFLGCESLTNLDLSVLNTSNVINMSEMFCGCDTLTSLNLSNINTSNVTDMTEMFRKCESLISLDLSSFNTSNVTTMDGMFAGCSSLTNLNLTSFDTNNVTSMYTMFANCESLTNLDLSNFNTSSVTNMNSMFHRCHSLTSVDVSSFNTSNVTNMYGMFSYCESLKSLDLSSFDTSNVTTMEYMFGGDSISSLTSIDLSSFDTSKVTSMSYMFKNCANLTTLDLSSFDTSKVESVSYMFSKCTNLTEILVGPKWTTENVDTVSMFYECGTQEVTLKSE